MENQTHYKTLNIDNNAPTELIKLAYEQLLKDAKEKLFDSPIYFEKEKKLNEAFEVLSNEDFRQAYDLKLIREKAARSHASEASEEPLSSSQTLVNKLTSKGFIAVVVAVIVGLFLFPSGKDRTESKVANKGLDNKFDIQNQWMNLERQKEQRVSAAEQRRLDLKEDREKAKMAREERLLQLAEERESRRVDKEFKRENERRKRQKEYEIQKRSRDLIRQANAADYKRYYRSSGNSGNGGSLSR